MRKKPYDNNLRYYRDTVLAWTKEQFAKDTGVSSRTIAEIEKNNTGSSTTRNKICNSRLKVRHVAKNETDFDCLK